MHVASAALLSLLSLATAISTSFKTARLEALAARAEAAVMVKVESSEARFEGGRIVTDLHCTVIDSAFGANAGESLTVTVLGGFRGNIGQTVFGLDRPGVDEELAVLLGPDGYMSGGRRVVGFSLGIYHVLRAESELPRAGVMIGADTIYRGPLREDAPLTVDEFFSRAKAAKAQQR